MMTQDKAKKMLHDNSAQGHPLTKKQRGLFGVIASGKKPRRKKKSRMVTSYNFYRD